MSNRNLKPTDKALTQDQCAKVLAAAESEMKGLVLMAMTTGQGVGSIMALKRCDVDMHRGIIRFRLEKTGRRLEIPLAPRMRMWLEQQPQSTVPVDPDAPLFPQLAARGVAKAGLYLRELGHRVGVAVTAASLRRSPIDD